VTATQLTTFLRVYCCNYNITLQMAAIPAEACWWEYNESNTS